MAQLNPTRVHARVGFFFAHSGVTIARFPRLRLGACTVHTAPSTINKQGGHMAIFAKLVMTLVGMGAFAFWASQIYALSARDVRGQMTAFGCIIGAGVGLWFGRLIAGPPPKV